MASLSTQTTLIIVSFMAWVWAWKGVALWKAARLSHKKWFVAFVILNLYSLGIVEIIYIFLVASKYKVETKEEVEDSNTSDSGTSS